MAKNTHRKAKDILPAELVSEIQRYFPKGGYLWVPSLRKATIKERNNAIYYQRRVLLLSIKDVALTFGMSMRNVIQIVTTIEENGVPENLKEEVEEIRKQREQSKLKGKGTRGKYKKKSKDETFGKFDFD